MEQLCTTNRQQQPQRFLTNWRKHRRFWNGILNNPDRSPMDVYFRIDDAKIIGPRYTFVNGDGRPGTYPISRLCPWPWDFSPRWCRASDCWSSGCKTTTSTSGHIYPSAAPSNPSRTPVSQWSRPAGKTVCNYENNARFETFIATMSAGGTFRERTERNARKPQRRGGHRKRFLKVRFNC